MADQTYTIPLKHRLECVAILALSRFVAVFPSWLTMSLAGAMGALASVLIPVRRHVIRRNLDIAFGDSLAPSEKRRLTREAYKALAMLFVETCRLQVPSPEWIRSRVVEVEGEEHLEKLYSSGQAFISVSGHFGSWELLGAYGSLQAPTSPVSKPLHNRLVQERVSRTRSRLGMQIIWTGRPGTIGEINRAIESGRVVNFMADQDAGHAGIFVPFFGKPASTISTPAVLALRHNVPIVPSFLVRLGPTRHRHVIFPPILPSGCEASDRQGRIAELTSRHVKALEDMIRLYPAQYFWFHRRWKTTPQAVEKRKASKRRRRLEALRSQTGETSSGQPSGTA